MEYEKRPKAIEAGSMAIIESEMANPSQFTEKELKVIKRVIHTTADFEYEARIRFGHKPLEALLEAAREGCKIYADTNMIAVAVNRLLLKEYGCEIVNYVHAETTHMKAKEQGITRSMVSIEQAFYDEEIKIFLIGNAPTALIRLLELAEEKGQEKIIVGVPVGFVGAAESKEALMMTQHKYVTVEGRKGGSPVAAAIMNAILKIGQGE